MYSTLKLQLSIAVGEILSEVNAVSFWWWIMNLTDYITSSAALWDYFSQFLKKTKKQNKTVTIYGEHVNWTLGWEYNSRHIHCLIGQHSLWKTIHFTLSIMKLLVVAYIFVQIKNASDTLLNEILCKLWMEPNIH